MADVNNSKALIGQRYGSAPNVSEVELFSLWLTGLSPLTEEEKLQCLLSQNTKERLERCVQRLAQYVQRIDQRRQITSMISQAGSTIFTSANNAIRNIISTILPSDQHEEDDDGDLSGDENDDVDDHSDRAMDSSEDTESIADASSDTVDAHHQSLAPVEEEHAVLPIVTLSNSSKSK